MFINAWAVFQEKQCSWSGLHIPCECGFWTSSLWPPPEHHPCLDTFSSSLMEGQEQQIVSVMVQLFTHLYNLVLLSQFMIWIVHPCPLITSGPRLVGMLSNTISLSYLTQISIPLPHCFPAVKSFVSRQRLSQAGLHGASSSFSWRWLMPFQTIWLITKLRSAALQTIYNICFASVHCVTFWILFH